GWVGEKHVGLQRYLSLADKCLQGLAACSACRCTSWQEQHFVRRAATVIEIQLDLFSLLFHLEDGRLHSRSPANASTPDQNWLFNDENQDLGFPIFHNYCRLFMRTKLGFQLEQLQLCDDFHGWLVALSYTTHFALSRDSHWLTPKHTVSYL